MKFYGVVFVVVAGVVVGFGALFLKLNLFI